MRGSDGERQGGAPGIGDTLAGRYRLTGLLGRGAMGTVFSAENLRTGRRVALKLLSHEDVTPTARARFEREARAAAALRHEHIVDVLDLEDDPETGRPFIVQELLEGQDLRALLDARGALPLTEALDLLLPVLDALAAAHAAGIVHRDLKPENIFLARVSSGRVVPKVIDFGVARQGHEPLLTRTGVALGTPCYMSPEQVRGDARLDARSDLWAFGAVLFEALSGERVFSRPSLQSVFSAVLSETPPSLASRVPSLPPSVCDLVRRCLQRAPDARPQSASELARELAPFARPREPLGTAPTESLALPSGPPPAPAAAPAPAPPRSPLEETQDDPPLGPPRAEPPSVDISREKGARAGEYTLVRRLAVGGMDEIHEALEPSTGRAVALKLPLRRPDALALARFTRGARLAASLHHPRIVRTYAHGVTEGGTPWAALELLHGEDLDARLARGPLSPEETRTLGLQVCEALAYAHARRAVHRDLTPRNVFLCGPPGSPVEVKLLDLGLARTLDDPRLTGSDALVGTLAYLSPERAAGAREVSALEDLWSLGVVLFQCLTGRLPFEAENVCGVLYQITHGPTPDPRALRPETPPGLARALQRALRKSPAQRLATAEAFSEALRDEGAVTGTEPPEVADQWLVSAVYLDAVRDLNALETLAEAAGARTLTVGDDGLLALFGGASWAGDEPLRAARFAASSASLVARAGVATGRASGLDPEGGSDAAVDRAARLAHAGVITLDEATAAIARGALPLTPRPDGSASLDLRPTEAGTWSSAHATGSGEPTLLGRETERALLSESVARAVEGQAQHAVVLVASSGMGKSRLLTAALAEVRARHPGVTVLSGRGDARRRETAYAALTEALGALDPLASLSAHEPSPGADPQALRDRVHAALEGALSALTARGPVVLVLDDAQWLDPASLSALRWLSDALPDAPWTAWLSTEPEGRDAARGALPGAQLCELGPLVPAAAERLVRALAPILTAPEVADVVTRGEGNPLFLEALSRLRAQSPDGGEELPTAVEAVHQALLHRLDRADREFLKISAVFGRTAWLDAVASCGADPDAYPRLRRAGLVAQRSPSRFEPVKELAFRSGTLREVAYALWPDERRRALHREAARWLSPRPGVTHDELAHHWDEAGEVRLAAVAWVAATERALGVGDVSGARTLATRALSRACEPDLRWRALVALDSVLQIDADRVLQRSGLDELSALAAGRGEAALAEVAWRWCFFSRAIGDREGAEAHGARAIARAHEDRGWWAAAAHVELSLLDANAGRYEPARAHADAAEALASGADDPWLVARAATTQAYVLGEVSSASRSLALFDRAARAYAAVGDRRRESTALVNSGYALLRLGRLEPALDRVDSALELSRRSGNPYVTVAARQNRATILRALGRYEEAGRDADAAADEARRLGRLRQEAAARIERAWGALALGESAPVALADEALSVAQRSRDASLVASARAVSLHVRATQGALGPDDVSLARVALAAVSTAPETSLELASALWRVTGDLGDLAAARAALLDAERVSGAEEDPETWRRGLARRYGLPPEVFAREPSPT